MDRLFPKLPLAEGVEAFVEFLTDNLQAFFDGISSSIEWITKGLVKILGFGSPFILIALIALIALLVVSWRLGLFTLIGLGLINNLGYWDDTVNTLALIIVSVLIAIIIAIPIGIWMSQKSSVQSIISPILDFMQTMPAFVYLIPSVVFFGLGMVPGVIATIIFSMPPTVRLTNLGIREVDAELIEASNAFGATTWQRLIKVQIPLATSTIMAGINQTIMLSLSMVVIASLVGAPGLGEIVYRAVTQIDIGKGFEGGLALVILAMVLDRITQGVTKKRN
ncbi:ABC transporter permease [Bacillaceae bacterium W0354]